jgi:hypothetical protein
MELQRIEYIRKSGRKKGHKKGVLFCGIDPDDSNTVILGFTLCHSIDRFDYIEGQREKGFGVETARLRAEKWKYHTEFFVQKTYTELDIIQDDISLMFIINPNPREIVEIPPSVMVRLKTFIERCKKYYKDKEFPAWIENIENGIPYPKDQLEMTEI